MLVLTRTVGQTIVLSNGVTVKVVDVRGRSVRLGIDCPDDVDVDRGELLEASNG
jgi:carbon storage regulator